MKHAIITAYARHFIIGLYAVWLYSIVPDEERHRLFHVCPHFHWSRVVWHDGYRHRLIPLFHLVVDGFYHPVVKVLYRLEL